MCHWTSPEVSLLRLAKGGRPTLRGCGIESSQLRESKTKTPNPDPENEPTTQNSNPKSPNPQLRILTPNPQTLPVSGSRFSKALEARFRALPSFLQSGQGWCLTLLQGLLRHGSLQKKGTPRQTPQYSNPYYRKPPKPHP